MTTARSSMFHVGIVVPQLEDARERFGQMLGLAWGPIIDGEAPFITREGRTRIVKLRFSYSIEAPHVELIEEVPDTPWVCNEFSNLHHIGFFSGDVDAQSQQLIAAGCPFEFGARAGSSHPMTFCYNRDELGVRFEFVSEGRRSTIEEVYARPPSPH